MQKQKRLARAVLAASLFTLFGAASVSAQPASAVVAPYQAAIASPARTDADRQDDAKRKPAQFLAFAKVRPGIKALDLASGAGSTAALLALAVAPGGEVWAQTSKPSSRLNERVAGGALPNLHPLVAPIDNPIPPDLPPLDLITINMSYHDIVNTPADRAAMNKRLYQALKPGGYLVVIDNAAKRGSGLSATKTLHRIDEEAVVGEVTKAGFAVDARSDYLRVPSDPREQPFFKMEGAPDDKFALRFVKK
jgi:predicted methyltransferase